MLLNFIFKTHLSISFYMLGIIWLIQIIHYPLFKYNNTQNWQVHHSSHIKLTSFVIAIPMIIELISLSLLFYLDPANLVNDSLIICAILLIIIWSTTFFISVPIHKKLAVEFDEKILNKLIRTNWIRTIAWSLKSFILLFMIN